MKKTQLNKTYFIYFSVILVFVLLRIASSFGVFSFVKNATVLSLVTSVIIQVLILFLLPFILTKFLLKKPCKQIFKDYKFKKINFKVVLISFALGVLACILNFFIAFIFSAFISMLGYEGLRSLATSTYSYDTLLKFLVGVFCVGILPAFCEEFLHRGFVLNETQKNIGYKRAIIISSILFGLMHLNINQVFYAIILGLIMGFVVVACDNIWPAVIMHFTNNFINVYLEFATVKSLPLGNLNNLFFGIFSQNFAVGIFVSSLVICFAVFGIIYLISILFKNTRYKQIENSFLLLQNDIQSVENDGNPLSVEEAKLGFDIYFKERFKNTNSLIDLMIPKSEQDNKKPTLKNNIFLIGSLVLGIIITVFTFIWGVF